MPAPPPIRRTAESGSYWDTGDKAKRRDAAINAAHTMLSNCGVDASPAKVARMVRRFDDRLSGSGWTLFDYLATQLLLTADQRGRAANDPSNARVIAYSDPTGETAIRNVLASGRR